MAGPLDDLDFSINAHVRDAMDDIKRLNEGLNQILKSVDNIDAQFRSFGQSMGLPAAQVELLMLKFQPLINSLSRAKKQAGSLEETFTRRLMQKALEEHQKKIIKLADGTEQARFAMIRLSQASQQIRAPEAPRAAGGGGGQSSGVNFVRVTAAAGQLAILARVSSTMRGVRESMDTVGRSSQITAGYMSRFRMGLGAVEVNPALNVVKNGFDTVGNAASKGIDLVRGIADAFLSDLPGSASAAVGAMGSVNSALDSVSATASKHVAKLQQMRGSLDLLSNVFPFAADSIARFRGPLDVITTKAEGVADKIDEMNASVGTAAAEMRGKTYVMTGAWTELSGSADLFARSQYYALLPQRMLMREFEGGQRIIKAASYAFNFLTHPIHAVSLAVGQSRAVWQDLNARLPKVNTVSGALSGSLRNLASQVIASTGITTRLSAAKQAFGVRLSALRSSLSATASSGYAKLSQAMAPITSRLSTAGASVSRYVGSLQLGTRAHRLFAQSAFIVGTSTRTVVAVLSPVARLAMAAGRGVWSMISPARSAAQSLAKLTGVQNTFIGRALGMKKAGDDAAATMAKMDASSGRLGRGMSFIGSKAGLATTAAAGLAAGMIALGTSTAIATEKSNAVFGVMMKDMGQGAAVVKSLQGTQAAKLFDNQELLQSGVLLFKSGVSATALAGKTNQLATIAAATSTELGDLARIYQQGANTGSFGQDKINQLAERGIDIYHALEAATGANGAELKKMISDGKIGLTEMDAALAHLTTGNGIYAGSLDVMANTTAGKMATIKNNVSQALGQVMGVAIEVLQPFGSAIVTLSESLSAAFASFREPIIYAATSVAWFFGNLITIGQFAWASTKLFAVTAFNDIAYWFTDKLPAYLTWFSQNWKQVFWDAGNLIVTVFANIGKNIGSAMKSIWNYIKSGGTAELSFAFVPLLDGFKATVSELPEIPDRAMTELEKSLTAQTEGLGGQLADNFDSMLADAQTKVDKGTPEIKDTAGKLDPAAGDGADSANKAANKAAENKAIGVQSAEGQSLAAQIQRGMLTKEDKALKVQEDQKTILERMERNQRKQGAQQGKPF
jgi:tape measure domain-containing protein